MKKLKNDKPTKERKPIEKTVKFKNFFVFSILDLLIKCELSFHLYDMRKPDIYKYIHKRKYIFEHINIVYIEYYNEELEITTH